MTRFTLKKAVRIATHIGADFEEYELEEGAATQQEKSKKVEPEFIEPKFEAKEVVRCHVIEEAAVSVPEDYTPFLT